MCQLFIYLNLFVKLFVLNLLKYRPILISAFTVPKFANM